jgi:uncharacterized protein
MKRRIRAVAIAFLGVLSASAADKDRGASVVAPPSRMAVRALRLGPGADLKRELSRFARENGLRAGVVLTCVGSLTRAVVRLADQPEGTSFEGKHEIVALVGTLSPDGDHLHMAVSDSSGRTIGGHLMVGSLVYTTAEIAVGELTDLAFARETDPATTYRELAIRRR